jgi:predicted nucleic acid-binding protein
MTVETRTFVDTNVLVYAHDVDAGNKHEIARELLRRLWENRQGVMSTQVLQEFYVTVTRKLPKPLDRPAARRVVSTYRAWPIQEIAVADILSAAEMEERHQLSFWDALILTSARRAGAGRVVSEDFGSGRQVEGLVIENLFSIDNLSDLVV